MARPFEFIQLKNKVLQIFEWGKVWRVIYTDGRKVPDQLPAGPYWYGYSVGGGRATRSWSIPSPWIAVRGSMSGARPFGDDTRVQERWRRQATIWSSLSNSPTRLSFKGTLAQRYEAIQTAADR